MRRGALVLAAALPVLAAGCMSPAEVESKHADAQRTYRDDLAAAEEWNQHVLGVPASGWVAILIAAAIGLTIVLAFGIVSLHDSFEDRRRKAHGLALEREKTRQEIAKRGPCATCGTVPLRELTKERDET